MMENLVTALPVVTEKEVPTLTVVAEMALMVGRVARAPLEVNR